MTGLEPTTFCMAHAPACNLVQRSASETPRLQAKRPRQADANAPRNTHNAARFLQTACRETRRSFGKFLLRKSGRTISDAHASSRSTVTHRRVRCRDGQEIS